MGTLVARVGIPSFVVTLAAFLAFQGTVLLIIGEGGNVAIRDSTILAIENRNLAPLWGWVLWAVSIGAFAAIVLLRGPAPPGQGPEPPSPWPSSPPRSARWPCSPASPSTCSTWSAAATPW